MVFFLFLLFSEPVKILRVDLGELHKVSYPEFYVTEHGIFANTLSGIKRFDFEGNLLSLMPANEDTYEMPRTYSVVNDIVWVTDLRTKRSSFFSIDGTFLYHDEDICATNVSILEDGSFAITPAFVSTPDPKNNVFKYSPNLNSEPYPRLVSTFDLKITAKGVTGKELQKTFFKAPKLMSEKRIQFKRLWVFKDVNDYHVINQVENKSYFYSPHHILQEKKVPKGQSFEARSSLLNLPNFNEVLTSFEGKPFYKDTEDYHIEVLCWLRSHSLIENVVAIPNGYLVGYIVPQPDCGMGRLMVAKINKNFRFQTVVVDLEEHGFLAGAHDGKVYVVVSRFVPEGFSMLSSDPEIRVYDLGP